MNKPLSIALAAAVSLATLAGCSSKSNEPASPTPTEARTTATTTGPDLRETSAGKKLLAALERPDSGVSEFSVDNGSRVINGEAAYRSPEQWDMVSDTYSLRRSGYETWRRYDKTAPWEHGTAEVDPSHPSYVPSSSLAELVLSRLGLTSVHETLANIASLNTADISQDGDRIRLKISAQTAGMATQGGNSTVTFTLQGGLITALDVAGSTTFQGKEYPIIQRATMDYREVAQFEALTNVIEPSEVLSEPRTNPTP